MGAGPWAPAQEVFNKFARMDRTLVQKLNNLSENQAHHDKLAFALESGRIYGLRQQKYNMVLKRQLDMHMKRPPVEDKW